MVLFFLVGDLAHLAQPLPRCCQVVFELENFNLRKEGETGVSIPPVFVSHIKT